MLQRSSTIDITLCECRSVRGQKTYLLIDKIGQYMYVLGVEYSFHSKKTSISKMFE